MFYTAPLMNMIGSEQNGVAKTNGVKPPPQGKKKKKGILKKRSSSPPTPSEIDLQIPGSLSPDLDNLADADDDIFAPPLPVTPPPSLPVSPPPPIGGAMNGNGEDFPFPSEIEVIVTPVEESTLTGTLFEVPFDDVPQKDFRKTDIPQLQRETSQNDSPCSVTSDESPPCVIPDGVYSFRKVMSIIISDPSDEVISVEKIGNGSHVENGHVENGGKKEVLDNQAFQSQNGEPHKNGETDKSETTHSDGKLIEENETKSTNEEKLNLNEENAKNAASSEENKSTVDDNIEKDNTEELDKNQNKVEGSATRKKRLFIKSEQSKKEGKVARKTRKRKAKLKKEETSEDTAEELDNNNGR